MITWCPETAKVKKKMLYSSSHDALKRALGGVKKYIQVLVYYWAVNQGSMSSVCNFQATDESEASQDTVLAELRNMDRV